MIMKKLIEYLLNENASYMDITVPTDEKEQFRLYRSLVNVRPAMKISVEYLKAEDKLLRKLTAEKGITDITDLQPIEKIFIFGKAT